MALLMVVTVLRLFVQVVADSNNGSHPHTHYASVVDEQESMELVRQDPGIRRYYVQKNFYATYSRQGCRFDGYKPNGPVTSVDKMDSPLVLRRAKWTLVGVVKGWGRKLSKVIGIAMHVTKLSTSLTKAAPALAPTLGIISGVMGMLSEEDPLVEIREVYKAVRRAFEEYSKELDVRLKQMEDYVDASILDSNFQRERDHYRAFWKQWANCVKEPTEKLSVKCQMDEIKKIVARDHWFMKNHACFKNGKSTCKITFKKVRQLEVYILLFRDYVNLVIMEYIPLIEYFCWLNKAAEHAAHNCRRFTQEVQDKLKKYIDFAEGAVSYIKKAHKGGEEGVGSCRETFSCKTPRVYQMHSFLARFPVGSTQYCKCRIGFWHGKKDSYCHTSHGAMWNRRSWCRCHINGGYVSLSHCTRCNTIDVDDGNGNVHDRFAKAFNAYGLSLLLPIAKRHQKASNAVVEKFYKQEIYDFIAVWKAAIGLASCMQKDNSQTDAPEIPLWNAIQSSTMTYAGCAGNGKCAAANAIDGDVTTYSVTLGNWPSWWAAQLSSRAVVGEVIFSTSSYAFKQGYFNRLQVEVADFFWGPWTPCKKEFKMDQPIVNHVVKCDHAKAASFVKLAVDGGASLYLSEVKVKEKVKERNAVTVKIPLTNATQSSTMTKWGCAGKGTCAADKALDGDRKTHSTTWGNYPSWWSARLEVRAVIKEVILSTGSYPFKQGYFNRLQVDVANIVEGPWNPCKREFKMNKPFVNHVVKCDQVKAANFVRITVYGGVSLYLDEVKVMGEISGLCPGLADVSKLGEAE